MQNLVLETRSEEILRAYTFCISTGKAEALTINTLVTALMEHDAILRNQTPEHQLLASAQKNHAPNSTGT